MNPALITLTGDAELMGRRHHKKRKGTVQARVESIKTGIIPSASPSSFDSNTVTESSQMETAPAEEVQNAEVQEIEEGALSGIRYRNDDVLMGREIINYGDAPTPAVVSPLASPVYWVKKNPLIVAGAVLAIYFLFFKKKHRR